MQITIDNVSTSKTGKSLRIKSGNDWYGANKDCGLSKGMTVDAEVSHGDFGAWIDKWKPIGSAAPQVAGEAQASTPKASAVPAVAAPVWSNFVSNQVAHAIQAGLIQSPEQIKVWAAAAKQAFVELA